MRKFSLILITCAVVIFTLTGCWDKKELTEIAFVIAVGLDIDDTTGEYINTAQIIRTEAMRKEGGTGDLKPTKLITTHGKTLLETRKEQTKKMDRNPFYPHAKIMIISEKLAKAGIRPVLDRLMRSNEVRPLDWIIVTKGITPEEALNINGGITRVQGFYLDDLIRQRERASESRVLHLQQFVEELLGVSESPITGVFELVDNTRQIPGGKTIKLSGAAVFKKDKLHGYLDNREIKALNWVTGKIKRGTITVSSPDKNGLFITTNIKKVKNSISPDVINGEYIFNINISLTTELGEQHNLEDTSNPGVIQLIEKRQEKYIKKEVEMIIDKSKNEIKLDIANFGSSLSKKYPREWEKIKDDWEEIFPSVSYKVNVSCRTVRTGRLLKPIKKET